MSLLEDEESGDEIHRVNTNTNFLSQATGEAHSDGQDRQAQPKADGKKEKKGKQSDEHRKGGTLTLPWRKDKDKDKDKDKEEKQAKRTKQAKSKSPPPNSPKSSRAADKKALKPPSAPQPLPSPNTKASRKPYAQLSAEEDEFEELVMNVHSANEERHLEGGLDLGKEMHHPYHHTVEGHLEQEPPKKAGVAVNLLSLPIGPLAAGTRANPVEVTSGLVSPVLPPPPPVAASLPVTINLLATSLAVGVDIPSQVNSPPVNSGDLLATAPLAATPSAGAGVGAGIGAGVGAGVGSANPAPDSEWLVSDELREKCHKQFASLNPEAGLLSGEKARDFFIQSKLPTPELAQIWHLADHNCDGALSEDEFLIAMKLVLVRRKGFDIPAILPNELIPRDGPGPPLGDLLLLGDAPPINPSVVSASNLQPSVGPPLEDLTYTAPIGADPEDIFAPQQSILSGGDFAVGSNHPELILPVHSLGETTMLDGHLGTADPSDPTLLSLVTDDLLVPAHMQPTIGDFLSFKAEPLEGGEEEEEEEKRGGPAIGKLVSIEPEPTWDGEEEKAEEPLFSPSGQSACEAGVPREARVGRTRHTSVRDEENSPPQTSPVKKSKSLRTPVRPAPPVPSQAKEKPSGDVQQRSPTGRVELTAGSNDPAPLLMSSSNEKLEDIVNEGEWSDNLGTITQRKRASAMPFDLIRGHGRSASLDLNKMFVREEGHEGLPSATPPKPPPKPMKAEHSVEEVAGGYLLIKSASTGSISNAALAGQEVPPTSTTSRQPAKVALLTRVKVQENFPPQKEESVKDSATTRVQIPTPPKEEGKKESVITRNKQELQASIQQYKETNATLTAINKELEAALFKLISDRVDLQQKFELLQKQ